MRPDALKDAFQSLFQDRGNDQFTVRIASDGVNMTTGQAMEIFNRS